MVLLVPMSLGRNIKDEGFSGVPRSPLSKTKFGLSPVPARVSKKDHVMQFMFVVYV